MTIAIDLTSLSYHMTGIERYAACVTEKMLEQDYVNNYILVFRDMIYPIFERFVDSKRIKAVILHGNKKLIFLQLVLPYNLYKIRADKYLFFAFTSPILFRKKGIYNTIHDMGPWDSSEALKGLQKFYLRTTCKWAAKASEKIITVSNFSKERIVDILKLSEEKITVIYSAVYEGVTRDFGCTFDEVKKEYSLPNKYIMTLSTLEPRKNISILLNAFSKVVDKVDYDLVLVGRKGWKMDEVLQKYNGHKRIHITGFVKDEHVSIIYKNAICFVFPSLYEGFGLPPVEALALGTPVIASDAASIPEILMEQALYFSNNSIDELVNILVNLKENIDLLPRELNAFQRGNYNFKTSARKVLRLLEE